MTTTSVPVLSGPAQHDADRLNWLRAGVLGANDGVVSVAAVVIGVVGAGGSLGAVAAAGTAALLGGAVSMGLGEYVSVSGQRDAQDVDVEDAPVDVEATAARYRSLGASEEVARAMAVELSAPSARERQHAQRLERRNADRVSPWRAAWVSAATFTAGAVLPLAAAVLAPSAVRAAVVVVVVLAVLACAGWAGATLGRSPRPRATVRVLLGGAIALAATYGAGLLLHSRF